MKQGDQIQHNEVTLTAVEDKGCKECYFFLKPNCPLDTAGNLACIDPNELTFYTFIKNE